MTLIVDWLLIYWVCAEPLSPLHKMMINKKLSCGTEYSLGLSCFRQVVTNSWNNQYRPIRFLCNGNVVLCSSDAVSQCANIMLAWLKGKTVWKCVVSWRSCDSEINRKIRTADRPCCCCSVWSRELNSQWDVTVRVTSCSWCVIAPPCGSERLMSWWQPAANQSPIFSQTEIQRIMPISWNIDCWYWFIIRADRVFISVSAETQMDSDLKQCVCPPSPLHKHVLIQCSWLWTARSRFCVLTLVSGLNCEEALQSTGEAFRCCQSGDSWGLMSPAGWLFCCLLGLSAGLDKNCWTDFHKTWMEDGSRPRKDLINLWCWST